MIIMGLHASFSGPYLDCRSCWIFSDGLLTIFYYHFGSNVMLKLYKSWIPKPPSSLDLHSCPHATRLNFEVSWSVSYHKNPCQICLSSPRPIEVRVELTFGTSTVDTKKYIQAETKRARHPRTLVAYLTCTLMRAARHTFYSQVPCPPAREGKHC